MIRDISGEIEAKQKLFEESVENRQQKNILQNIIDFLPVTTVYQILLPVGLIMGIGIGFLGSFFTVRKHLKVLGGAFYEKDE